MRIQVLSDLHLNYYTDKYPTFVRDIDYIIIAGDLSDNIDAIYNFFSIIRKDCNVPIIWIFGNHEYYSYCLKDYKKKIKKELKSIENIIILDNSTYELNDYIFIGATLWTDFDNERDTFIIQQALNDYAFINTKDKSGQRNINYLDILYEHKKSKKFIIRSLKKYKNKKRIVITHHAPSYQSVSPQYKGSIYNSGFVNNFDNLLVAHQPDLWIHGHVHSFFDYYIDKTRIVCNPKGYDFEYGYLENFVIEV
jgi:Icc-related predicted phosphoesterase